MKNIALYLIAFVVLCSSCHHSKDNPEQRGEDCMLVLLLPESPYIGNDAVGDVVQQFSDLSLGNDIPLHIVEPEAGKYDQSLKQILSATYSNLDGDALLVAIDNSMRLTIYETNALGRFQQTENHRIELYGVGYLTGLCSGVIDVNTLILHGTHQVGDNLRYTEGFRVGFFAMHPRSFFNIQYEELSNINEIYALASAKDWKLVITNYGVAEPWYGEQYFDFDVDYGYGRLVEEYLDTWARRQKRKNAPDEVISLKSGYIEIILNNKALLSELVEVYWDEAIEHEEQYVSPLVPVE